MLKITKLWGFCNLRNGNDKFSPPFFCPSWKQSQNRKLWRSCENFPGKNQRAENLYRMPRVSMGTSTERMNSDDCAGNDRSWAGQLLLDHRIAGDSSAHIVVVSHDNTTEVQQSTRAVILLLLPNCLHRDWHCPWHQILCFWSLHFLSKIIRGWFIAPVFLAFHNRFCPTNQPTSSGCITMCKLTLCGNG